MKKLFTFLIFSILLAVLVSSPFNVSAFSPSPTDSPNECVVCPKDYNDIPGKGCCKLSMSSTTGDWLECRPTDSYKVSCSPDQMCIPSQGCRSTIKTSSLTADKLCSTLPQNEQSVCLSCMKKSGKQQSVWTGLGCVPVDISMLLSLYVMRFITGIAGGLSFLVFLYGTFLILTSRGDTERITKGKQYLISSLKGLILILFSVFIMRLFGVDILQIPGFS